MIAITETKTQRSIASLEMDWFCRAAQAPTMRTIREFAEEEIVLPDGPFAGRRFLCERQPYVGLWFDAIENAPYQNYYATGPTQSGKTLCGFAIVMLYHLFEMRETVICGLPNSDMVKDKWSIDILPVLERTRFREYLPRSGSGSRGGIGALIKFRHGPALRWMTGGGGDKARAAFTARVVIITETDGMDEAGEASREADKITQLKGRTRAYGSRARLYAECTVSIEDGRTWREYTHGTESKIALPCPHCGAYVTLERPDLQGWQGADTVEDARKNAHFACSSCSHPWTEDERRVANSQGLLIHKDQEIRLMQGRSRVFGDPPRTDTLGFRWSAVNNLFVQAGDIGADEWRASRNPDDDNAEKELLQFVWALPHKPSQWETTPIDAHALTHRVTGEKRGHAPAETQCLTMGIDIGKYLGHWMVIAWQAGATGYILDYGCFEIRSKELGAERAILTALREFREVMETGWPGDNNETYVPQQVWIDSSWQGETAGRFPVYEFCREAGQRYRPTKGYGMTQDHVRRYTRPKSKGAVIRHIGDDYHFSLLRHEQIVLVEINADAWKTFAHERLTTPVGEPGALTLFRAMPMDHFSLAKHLTAERQVEEFIAGKGTVIRWEAIRRTNHWLDALYLACGASHFCGVRLDQQEAPAVARPATPQRKAGFRTPDGRPFLATER